MMLADVVLAKKWELDALRAKLEPTVLDEFESRQRIVIICTSNALDGNKMSAEETEHVLQGATFTNKTLKDHLEVTELGKAIEWILALAGQKNLEFSETFLRSLHRQTTCYSNPEIAGRYADRPRGLKTDQGALDFPASETIALQVNEFCKWFAALSEEPEFAFDAHLRLMRIHPFNDGNGRASRLLMNFALARAGYPLVALRLEDGGVYRAALVAAMRGGNDAAFKELMFQRLDETMDSYLAAARLAQSGQTDFPAQGIAIQGGDRGHRPDHHS